MKRQPTFRSLETYDQQQFAQWLQDLPADDLHHYELLDGFIVREPPAGWPHGEIAVRISSLLGPFVRRGRLGRVFDSSQGFDLPSGSTVEPDVSFVSNARWAALATPIVGFIPVAPELVFEILSPSTKRLDQTRKKRIYARNDVLEYAMIDPVSKTLEQLGIRGGKYELHRSLGLGDTFRSKVLPGFVMPLAELFPEP